MNGINGWKGYTILSIVLFAFAIGMGIDNELPTWVNYTGASVFGFTAGIAMATARKLYKKSKNQ